VFRNPAGAELSHGVGLPACERVLAQAISPPYCIACIATGGSRPVLPRHDLDANCYTGAPNGGGLGRGGLESVLCSGACLVRRRRRRPISSLMGHGPNVAELDSASHESHRSRISLPRVTRAGLTLCSDLGFTCEAHWPEIVVQRCQFSKSESHSDLTLRDKNAWDRIGDRVVTLRVTGRRRRLGRLRIRLATLRFVVEGVGMLTAATATHSDKVSLGTARAYPAYVGSDPKLETGRRTLL
jgi:hypothetical protein